ncbi:MAG: PaaI family thioesterase [Terracidiphilus sp.]
MTDSHADDLTPFAHPAQNRCFGCGQANSTGLRLEFFLAPDGSVVCPAIISDQFEGPHGFLHGGIIATLLDESMSKAVRAKGLTAMTRHMEVDYRRPVPSGAQVRMEARVVRSEGRKHWAEAHILDSDGKALAQGKGLFVEVSGPLARRRRDLLT